MVADRPIRREKLTATGQSARGGFAFFAGKGETMVTGSLNIPSALASVSDILTKRFSLAGFTVGSSFAFHHSYSLIGTISRPVSSSVSLA